MRKLAYILSAVTLLASTIHATKAEHVSESEYDKADAVIRPYYEVNSIIKDFINKSHAYVVYPEVGKGAVGVGGAYGKGLVYERGILGYRFVGTSELTQVSVGLQIGGQTYQEIVFFQNEKVFNEFKKGKLQLSAQVSAVALKSGVSKNAKFFKGVAIFTLAEKGLMGELAVGGQVLSFKPAK